jgi:hypothetical protein
MSKVAGDAPPTYSKIQTGQFACSTSAQQLPAKGKGLIRLYNPDAAITIYYGADNTVTSSTGMPLPAGAERIEFVDDLSKLFVIAASGTPSLAYAVYS